MEVKDKMNNLGNFFGVEIKKVGIWLPDKRTKESAHGFKGNYICVNCLKDTGINLNTPAEMIETWVDCVGPICKSCYNIIYGNGGCFV